MVSEQMMAADAKSKMAANLLRLGFIEFFWFSGFSVYICVGTLFGGRTNVFLLGKSGNRGQNPPSFCRRPTKSRSISRCEFSEGKQTVQLQIRAVAIAPGVQGVAGIRGSRLHSSIV